MSVATAALAGGLLSFALVLCAQPRPTMPWRWPSAALLLHAACWLLMFGLALLIVRRPWFAMGLALGTLLVAVLIANAKHAALREAFCAQDFEYFRDLVRHPRLYLPFFGWRRLALAVLVFGLALVCGFALESAVEPYRALRAGYRLCCLLGLVALCAGLALQAPSAGNVDADVQRWGLIAAWLAQLRAERAPLPNLTAPDWPVLAAGTASALPDLFVLQAESFFDLRKLLPDLPPGALAHFDALTAESFAHGALSVPAWGANTVRSEFAFLTGQAPQALGIHRINPYRRIARTGLASLPAVLRVAGYRTVCVHPYPASFYQRDEIFPLLGFDEFIDITDFDGAERVGFYVSDAALVERALALRAAHRARSAAPLFVFMISMENHGPLELERLPSDELRSLGLAERSDLAEVEAELGPLWRHLRNADQAIGRLHAALRMDAHPACLAFYGDHVPVLPRLYAHRGLPDGRTPYCLWDSRAPQALPAQPRAAHELAGLLLSRLT